LNWGVKIAAHGPMALVYVENVLKIIVSNVLLLLLKRARQSLDAKMAFYSKNSIFFNFYF
jgi:hypothetical protein